MAVSNYFNFNFFYNCRGLFADKFQYINKLLDKKDFLLLLEHWLHSELVTFSKI